MTITNKRIKEKLCKIVQNTLQICLYVFLIEMYNGKTAGHRGMLTVRMHHLRINQLKNTNQFKMIGITNGIIIGRRVSTYQLSLYL